MQYTDRYSSPLGEILLAADDRGLTGLWFEGQRYYARGLSAAASTKKLPAFAEAKGWLDIYFAGKEPGFCPPLQLIGTEFQTLVWELLLKIPYGQTASYGELAAKLAKMRGLEHMSARAVGAAVGQNRISLIVPCHRVLGADGSLTGYAGGLERKLALLRLEGAIGCHKPLDRSIHV